MWCVICLMPKLPLQAQHAYTVRVDASWKGKPGTWTWSFSTGAAQSLERPMMLNRSGAKGVENGFHVRTCRHRNYGVRLF